MSVFCHRFVMASVSPIIKLSLDPNEVLANGEKSVILLPETNYQEVQTFVSFVYGAMKNSNANDTYISQSLAERLGLDNYQLMIPQIKLENTQEDIEMAPYPGFQDFDNGFDSLKEEELRGDHYSESEDEYNSYGWGGSRKRKMGHMEPGHVEIKLIKTEPTEEEREDLERRLAEEGVATTLLEPNADSSDEENEVEAIKSVSVLSSDWAEEGRIIAEVDQEPITDNQLMAPKSATDPLKSKYYKIMESNKSTKTCLAAVKFMGEEEGYQFRPLICNDSKKKHIVGSLNFTLESLHELLGIPKSKLLMGDLIIKRTGYFSKSKMHKLWSRIKQKLQKYSPSTLAVAENEALTQLGHLNSSESAAKKPAFKVNEMPSIRLTLNDCLIFKECDGLVLLQWNTESSSKEVKCYQLSFEEDCAWMCLVLDIWISGHGGLLASKHLENLFISTNITLELPTILRKMNRTLERIQEKKAKKERKEEEQKSRICPHCGKDFPFTVRSEKKRFYRHTAQHMKTYTCSFCQETFSTYPEKDVHIRKVHIDEKRVRMRNSEFINCSYCDLPFSKASLPGHIEMQHAPGICDVCGFKAETGRKLKYHFFHHHKKLTCEICNLEFIGNAKKGQHMIKAHQTRLPCPHTPCDKSFDKKNDLKRHILSAHVPYEERPYKCELCDKRFVEPHKVKHHMTSVHIKNRPHACRYGCGMDYNDPSNMYQHEKRAHGAIFGRRAKKEPQELPANATG